jgi:ABC-type ATPase involved in cell division
VDKNRSGTARAIVTDPRIIVADEPHGRRIGHGLEILSLGQINQELDGLYHGHHDPKTTEHPSRPFI